MITKALRLAARNGQVDTITDYGVTDKGLWELRFGLHDGTVVMAREHVLGTALGDLAQLALTKNPHCRYVE